ncbi:MAG TPA: rod shape-determining protein MreC [Actinomycetota bacterium]|nr:rod shape-determining protein MreC [Actinomycetota bacterium]
MLRLNERTRRVRLLLVVLLLASLTLVTIDFRSDGNGPLTRIGNAVASVFGPLQDSLSSVTRPIGNFFSGFGQVGSLKAQVRSLQEELALLRQDQGRVLDVLAENERLRSLIEIKDRLGLKTKAATVIGRDSSNFQQSIVIDIGTKDGVKKDMPVVGGEGLVGRVVQASASTATVLLIVDPSSDVASRVAETGEVGVLSGGGRRDMRLTLLNPNAIVTAGDSVVTASYRPTKAGSSVFPDGIPIGTISRVDPPGGNVTRRAFVKPAVDFTTLDFVLVVTGIGTPRPLPVPPVSPSPSPSPQGSVPASPSPHSSPRPSPHPSPGASR